jgi:hypothetical protein
MISRNLTRRLEELEARTAPAEPIIIEITYVSPDGSEVEGPRFEVPTRRARGPTWPWKSSMVATDNRCELHGTPRA